MKKYFSIICLIFLLTSCTQNQVIDEDSPLEHETEQIIHQIQEGDLEILVIDECEYIVFKDKRGSNHGFGYMAHKGNCSNPLHFYRDSLPSNSSPTKTNETN